MATHALPSVLVLGHSFVRRLRALLHSRPTEEARGLTPKDKLYKDFDLRRVCHIKILGIGGRTIDKTIRYDWESIRAHEPLIVVVELGSNDLTDNCWDTQSICDALEAFVELLLSELGVNHVVTCKVINRRRQPFEGYNERVTVFNNTLTAKFHEHPHVTVWQHRGLVNPSTNIHLRDGIHLNALGNKALYKSYRRAILYALHKLRNCEWTAMAKTLPGLS